jgi:hypothetical protein
VTFCLPDRSTGKPPDYGLQIHSCEELEGYPQHTADKYRHSDKVFGGQSPAIFAPYVLWRYDEFYKQAWVDQET